MSTTDSQAPWTLCHAWHSDSDRAALALCSEQLRAAGITYRETSTPPGASAVKMHGHELVDAIVHGQPKPTDLRATAAAQRWAARIDPRAWQFMSRGDAVHGIPVAIHQSNCLWVHRETARAVAGSGGQSNEGLLPWLMAASRHCAAPLAIGGEPWQVGILLESLCLAVGGVKLYREAFVRLSPEALASAAMIGVLEQLQRAREFVDDKRLAMPWRAQLEDVRKGHSAVMAMGDWVAAAIPSGIERLRVAGFREENVFIADFFVPVAADGDPIAARVAAALTVPDFQARFSAIKGSAPAVLDARGPDASAAPRIDAPSLTFDQCCSVPAKLGLLEIVADDFVHRRAAATTAASLASRVRP